MRTGLCWRLFWVWLTFSVISPAHSQTLQGRFSCTECKAGDTLLLEAVYTPATGRRLPKFATLQLQLEDTVRKKQWRLRYPMEDGIATAAIILPSALGKGFYEVSFGVQAQMVHVLGRLVNQKKIPPQISLMAIANNKESHVQNIKLDTEGYFQIPNLLFEDKATFVFAPAEKHPTNWVDVEIECPVDSAYMPLATYQTRLAIGVPWSDTLLPQTANQMMFADTNSLQNVVVVGKKVTQAMQFEKEYVRGFFEGGTYTFDGLETDEIAAAQSVLDFLIGRVAGLDIVNDRLDGTQHASWRGYEPTFFVDEIETDLIGLQTINPSTIAIIKVFRPPFYGASMGSPGGAIAIYTKRGSFRGNSQYGLRNRFVIKGYTPQVYELVD